MIWDIVLGAWVLILSVAHVSCRNKLEDRFRDFKLTVSEKIGKRPDVKLLFSKNPDDFSYPSLGLCESLEEYRARTMFEVDVKDAVKELLKHNGIEYKYEHSKPETITLVKKPQRNRK